MKDYAQAQAQYADMAPEMPRPQRESACNDANRLVSKLESIIAALEMIQPHHAVELAEKARNTNETGLLDALDRAHHLASQIDRRLHEIAELVGRV
jgi:hypothetical protein